MERIWEMEKDPLAGQNAGNKTGAGTFENR